MPSGKSSKKNRASAREQARQVAQQQARRERASKIWLRGGVVTLIVAVAVVIVLIVATSGTDSTDTDQAKAPSTTPSTYVDGGITFGKGETPIVPPGTKPKNAPENLASAKSKTKKGAAHLVVYLDLQCPVCKSFEQLNGEHVQNWAKEGNVAVEYRPIAFLDDMSNGNRYSSRAANAVACVADSQPKKFMDTLTTLFAKQPKENGHGLSDKQLTANIKSAGVDVDAKIHTKGENGKKQTVRQCISNEFFKKSVSYDTKQALNKVHATPTVLLNGKKVDGDVWQNPNKFSYKVLKASGVVGNGK